MPPQAFEIVEFAGVFRKDMDDEVAVIGQNPLGVVVAFDAVGAFAHLREFLADSIADCLDLPLIRAAADHEVISERGDFAEIKNADGGGFLGFSGADGR